MFLHIIIHQEAITRLTALWVKFSADDIFKYFFYFFQETGFDISCKLSPEETICMKYQNLFFWEKEEKYYQCVGC